MRRRFVRSSRCSKRRPSFRSPKSDARASKLILRGSYPSRDARKEDIFIHIRIVKSARAENEQADDITGILVVASQTNVPPCTILQCNYLSPTISPSFPQVSPFATPRDLKIQRSLRGSSFLSLSE